jgi:hypothetical protein
MHPNIHQFHIPVMGTGFTIDSPIKIAHLGINAVVSIVDDMLCEQMRKHYARQYGLPFKGISEREEDSRARRISAYLDLIQDIVDLNFARVKSQEMFSGSEKDRYFRLLPDTSPIKREYLAAASLPVSSERETRAALLTAQMTPGSIDCNIMSKVDRLGIGKDGKPLSPEFSDGNAALRGFATSKISAGLVLSAGFNPRVYNYLAEFPLFYRQPDGSLYKRIILKVSDFRSAVIQGKYLAKKGLEISEFRIESGLNCGGHAFASDGQILPLILKDFRDRREELLSGCRPLVYDWYKRNNREYPAAALNDRPSITVQGGIGTHGEMQRLFNDYQVDGTGWGSPFLLVPEVTSVDEDTMKLLAASTPADLFLSGISPLGVPFNTIKGSGSLVWTDAQGKTEKPGSSCPKKFLSSNTEFTEQPICTASTEYQVQKIAQIRNSDRTDSEKKSAIDAVLEKNCLCHHLSLSALMASGQLALNYGRQAICPGPNIAWFNRKYSLDEMVDHIYGRIASLVPDYRPHMFAKELEMNVDYLEKRLANAKESLHDELKKMTATWETLKIGMEECLHIAEGKAYIDENLASLRACVHEQQARLEAIFESYMAPVVA